jgi:hypothetical protein
LLDKKELKNNAPFFCFFIDYNCERINAEMQETIGYLLKEEFVCLRILASTGVITVVKNLVALAEDAMAVSLKH